MQEKEGKKGGSENLGTALMRSVVSPGVVDIASDVAELALDASLDESLLKDVPVFGWIIKGYNTIITARERIFLSKVARFLKGIEKINEDAKDKFRKKLASNASYCQKVGENLVLLLERQDNMDKAFLLGQVFSGYICGKIEYEMFLRIASAIDRAFIGDLKKLEFYYQNIESYNSKLGKPFSDFLNDDIAQSLHTAGLLRSEGYTEDIYYKNNIGAHLIRLTKEQQ